MKIRDFYENLVRGWLRHTILSAKARLTGGKRYFQRKNPKYLISAVVIIKNESKYIREWVAYHKEVGIDHVYVYDNDSLDNAEAVLRADIDNGFVTYISFPGKNRQIDAYRDAVNRFGNDSEWFALLDADEFIVMVDKDLSLKKFLVSQSKSVSQIIVGWLVFGSSEKKVKEDGLVIERFKWHAKNDYISEYKPIFRPESAIKMNFPHWVDVIGKTVDEAGNRYFRYPLLSKNNVRPALKNTIRINHYYSKSWEEFLEKRSRGYADHSGDERSEYDFKRHDKNDESDTILNCLIVTLKKKLREDN